MANPQPSIAEAYKDYAPPRNVRNAISSLLAYVPQEYLAGLREIVLANALILPRKRRHEKAARGIYHQPWEGQAAWIEIFVDTTLEGWPRLLTKSELFLALAFAEVLYHEIGHHRRFVSKTNPAESEILADKLASLLSKNFFRKKYWYLYPFMYAGGVLYRTVSRTKG